MLADAHARPVHPWQPLQNYLMQPKQREALPIRPQLALSMLTTCNAAG